MNESPFKGKTGLTRVWNAFHYSMAGLAAARARGRKGGRKFALSKAQVRLAQAAMAERDTSVAVLCKELGVERVTLYRYVGPKGELRDYGKRVLGLVSG